MELENTRTALRMLREKMVQRVIARISNRMDGRAPDLRVRMEQYPPLDETKRSWEAMVAKMLVQCLVDESTLLPMDVNTVHKRVRPCMGAWASMRTSFCRFQNSTLLPASAIPCSHCTHF